MNKIILLLIVCSLLTNYAFGHNEYTLWGEVFCLKIANETAKNGDVLFYIDYSDDCFVGCSSNDTCINDIITLSNNQNVPFVGISLH